VSILAVLFTALFLNPTQPPNLLSQAMATKLVYGILFLLPLFGHGQRPTDREKEQDVSTSPSRGIPTPTREDDIFLLQVTLQQAYASPGGSSEIRIEQSGANNRLRVNDSGLRNQTTLNQRGNNNNLEFDLLGDENDYLLVQQGNGNNLQMNNVLTEGVSRQVYQYGNDNLLEHNDAVRGKGVPMKIEQFGGARLIISNGPGY